VDHQREDTSLLIAASIVRPSGSVERRSHRVPSWRLLSRILWIWPG